ncbi:MAG: carboxypeptidase regulatory-like domain-containing protein [Methanomassiliicoccales archaeon]|nr:carboxypeptidase regulatory-like domain-containing protein [Methanomassiliicoccales archaeon]
MRNLSAFLLAAILISFLLSPISIQSVAQEGNEVYVRGFVFNERGAPLAGVNVTAINTTTNSVFFSVSNISGEYNLSLPSGTYNISASLTNYTANITYYNIIIDPSHLPILNFTMSEILGTLTGYVTNGTAPVPGATVHLRSSKNNYTGVSTSPLGEYTISGIAPGIYIAYAEKQGYWTSYFNEPVVIIRGKKTVLNFTLVEQPAKLYGRVYFGDSPVAGVQVVLQSQSFSASTTTDANGNYTLSNVPAGTYSLTFRKQGYQEKTVQITLSPFEEKRYDFSIEREAIEESSGFIPGFDLPHSLMVVALSVAIIILIISLFIRFKIVQNPELMAQEEPEIEEKEKEEAEEEK